MRIEGEVGSLHTRKEVCFHRNSNHASILMSHFQPLELRDTNVYAMAVCCCSLN
jgi:hypothetical protein